MLQIVPAFLLSAAIVGGFLLMSDRRRGTVLAQGVLVAGAVVFFVAIVAGPVAGLSQRALATVAVGVLSAASAGMLYHLYLGRFAEVRTARAVFVAVWLALSALYAAVFLSLV